MRKINMIFTKNPKVSMMSRGYTAFTLAEVLITLGIIGVIASLTIPTLLRNTQEAQLKASVKEAYSLINQAMMQAKLNNDSIKGICAIWDGVCFKNLFKPYLSYTKECDSQIITNGCWATKNYYDGTDYSWVNNATADAPAALVLKNGMLVIFRYHYTNCDYSESGATSNAGCGWIGFDINGFNKPNTIGKDTFMFSVNESGIKPFGITGDEGNYLTCDKNDTGENSGIGCTAKYLYE